MAKTPHPCKGMTKRTREVFEQIAIGNDKFHHPKVLEALLKRELIETYQQDIESSFLRVPMTINRYTVPLSVHMQWTAWCDETLSDEGAL